MFEASVRVAFSAGHRLMNHAGKCRFPHGHSYEVEIVLAAGDLTPLDWIEDFGIIKAHAREILEETVDHAFIVDSRDRDLIDALQKVDPVKLYVLDEAAPTAERIAEELFSLFKQKLRDVTSIRVWETQQQSCAYFSG